MSSNIADEKLPGGVIVTGGGSGIGRGAILGCAQRGASVAALDVDVTAAESAAEEALSLGAPAAIGLRCDVRDEASVISAIAMASDHIGPIRGLVTSAGVERHFVVHECDTNDWLDLVNINLIGTFHACKQVLIRMMEQGQGGSIVLISSALASVAIPGGFSAYCTSKGGVSSLMQSLALDYGPHGIRVNAVIPGATETPLMWDNTLDEDVDSARAAIERLLAIKRLARPSDIAEGITWLLSDRASYVTGSSVAVDGGLLARAALDS